MTSIAININGGLGRVVAALPMLQSMSEDPETRIITNGFDELFDLTTLKTIEGSSGNILDVCLSHDVHTPEPYRVSAYLRGEIDMSTAFFKAMGSEETRRFYGLTPAYHSVLRMAKLIQDSNTENKPICMIHPTASGEGNIRNMSQQNVINAIAAAKQDGYYPLVIGVENLGYEIDCLTSGNTSLTDFISLIFLAEVVICCDSAALHLSKALDKRTVVLFTSTAGTKYYPEMTEFRHPTLTKTFEYPRLFRQEIKQGNINYSNGCDKYIVPVEEFIKSIHKDT